MILKKNVGYLDSIIRVMIGALIMAAGIYFDSWLGLIGLMPILSGVVSFCPVYKMMGIETTHPGAERAN